MHFCGNAANLGANAADATNCYLSTSTVHSKVRLITIMVSKRADSRQFGNTGGLLSCNFTGCDFFRVRTSLQKGGAIGVGGNMSGSMRVGTSNGLSLLLPGDRTGRVDRGLGLGGSVATPIGGNSDINRYRVFIKRGSIKDVGIITGRGVRELGL